MTNALAPLPTGRPNPRNIECCRPAPAGVISYPNILEIRTTWTVKVDSPFPRVVIPLTDMGVIECVPLDKGGGSETNDVYRGQGTGTNHRLIIPTGGVFVLKATTVGRALILDCPVGEALNFFANPLPATSLGGPIVMAAPAVVAVGAASGLVVAANPNRKFLYLKNTDAAKTVSFAFDGNAAVLGSGVTLAPGQGMAFHAPGEAPSVGQVNGIASAASANVAVQEGS